KDIVKLSKVVDVDKNQIFSNEKSRQAISDLDKKVEMLNVRLEHMNKSDMDNQIKKIEELGTKMLEVNKLLVAKMRNQK
ncbi:MAG: hypothetical protein WC755_09115, partial [Candidatus Woesearchaeota archaeon]